MKVIVIGDYVNAISVFESFSRVGVPHSDFVFILTSGRNLVGTVFPTLTVVDGGTDLEAQFQNTLENFTEEDEVIHVLPTNEGLHKHFYSLKDFYQGKYPNFKWKFGPLDPDTIMDKEQFLEFCRPLIPNFVVNYYRYDSEDIKFPIFVKPKGLKVELKSKYIIRNRQDLTALAEKWGEKFFAENFMLMDLLSTDPRHNISVSGYYDSQDYKIQCTTKIVQHPRTGGSGDVVKVLSEFDQKIVAASLKICEALKWEGPFEIEFIRDSNGNLKINEMNPRFWMQHGLFNWNSNDFTAKRMLGLEVDNCESAVNGKRKAYWINPLYVVPFAFLLRMKLWRYIIFNDVFWPLSLGNTVKFYSKRLRKW